MGGWGAAKALVENGCRVTLLDALPDPTGKTPYLTPNKKPFEAGTRGFWMDYPNINKLVATLGLDEADVFTDFTQVGSCSSQTVLCSAEKVHTWSEPLST